MKKVLFVTDTLNGYGAEKILQWVGLSLSEIGYDVIFCEVYKNDNKKNLPAQVKILNLGLDRSCNQFYYLLKVNEGLRMLFKNNRCDYAVSFLKNSFYNLLLLRPFYHYKLVVSERNDPFSLVSFFERVKKRCVRFADVIVFQTEGARSYYQAIPQSKITIIPNPIDIPQDKWERGKTEKLIINVGRLHISKGQDLLIKAFYGIKHNYPDYKLVLLGDGPDHEKLMSLTKELGLQGSVVFMGKVANINEWLLRGSLFVLSSISEGIPNALMEAMAVGMPVISTNCSPGGARLLIQDNKNGLLVENESQEELEMAIAYMLDNPADADRMANQARVDMGLYDPTLIINEWYKIFN